MKKILFIIDKIELKYFEFNDLVTNFWLIKDFLEKGVDVYIATIPMLLLLGTTPLSKCHRAYLKDGNIFYEKLLLKEEINSFDLVMFRPDPPVDIDYINATYIFDFVSTRVVNSPKSIRNFNEKLHSLYFKDYMSSCIVTSSLNEIREFLSVYKRIVLKPLNRCFGAGVVYLQEGDPNTRTLINTLTNNESTMVMVQEFIPEVKNGDIRVLTLGSRIVPYSIRKLPTSDDFKFNTHNDDFLIKSELTKSDLEYFRPVAEKLNSMGIEMAGLDVVDNKIIEVNVTSPCYFIKEINNAFKVSLEKDLTEYLLTNTLLSL